jgi:polyphosphate kinase
LISAAKNGKNVVAFIELKARFDEANNIKWSKEMKDAGVRIIYSHPNIKVHSKIALIKRKNNSKELFAILSTGNFNEVTAQFYTDHVLMTSDQQITKELLQLFKFLELTNVIDHNKKIKFEALLVSKFNLIPVLDRLIDREIEKAQNGEPALIRIKVNNLEEPHVIDQLYRAGQAGVELQLLVRSICCLVPGIPGQSDNITVKRIVDRFLEHSRILIFGAEKNPEVYIGSADLMTRNLRHRIEVMVCIKNEACKNELLNYFEMQWNDNDKAVILLPGLIQKKEDDNGNIKKNAQQNIYNFLAAKK